MEKDRPDISEYLIRRIFEQGARHVFGVPGDYILNFYARLEKSPLQVINTCDEQGAGFAADAYARLHGLGVVCVTWNVGGSRF
jgi:indolepyruvate decarboxylase